MREALPGSVDLTRREVMRLARAIAMLGVRRRSLVKRLTQADAELREKKKFLAGLLASSIGAEVTGGDDAPSTAPAEGAEYPIRSPRVGRRKARGRARHRRSAQR